MEECVGVKRGKARRTSPRVAGLFRRVFGAVMYMSVRWTIEFLYVGASFPVWGEDRDIAHSVQPGVRSMEWWSSR
jgi:hypothetical protein